ncbi:uncharacterized protein LOC115434832 isoform X3 [Sphaeramia orbicularis]|uniref:uncharacterized protein LOC115434832 isoform X3 n=1 Tax=Sphaeramia orbicularis TaxID=375764 RepID=UPI00117FFBAA|nr:uncharacterized protein LOC115434832 isoform X3 [Sphaeramia orbicularis]
MVDEQICSLNHLRSNNHGTEEDWVSTAQRLSRCGSLHEMSGFSHFLLSLCISACILCSSTAWYVHIPRYINALKGSCLVIPCSFDYYQHPPTRPNRVVWYQYVNHGYPLVCDDWYPNDVIRIFKGKTRVYTADRKCTLMIDPVTESHHSQKIYPWVDPENVGRSTYRFFDTAVTIQVQNSANQPSIVITGDMKVGQSVTVQCSIYHTCSIYPPTLSVNIPLRSHSLVHQSLSDGTSKTTLTTILSIEKDQQTIQCSARHRGGITQTASTTLNAQCSVFPLTITNAPHEFLEGVASSVVCTASYTCPQQAPTLTWNYDNMPASTKSTQSGSAKWVTVSTLKLTASAKDHGKNLICYAHFDTGRRQDTKITIRVKRNMVSRDWSFSAPGSITAMKGSCVVIPCTFTYKTSQPAGLQVKWYLYNTNAYPLVYDTSGTVVSKFNGRTSLIGSVMDGNCSLKVERLEMTHNQDRVYPWVDKNPVTSYHTLGSAFYDKTTLITISDQAQEPQLNIIGIPRVGAQSRVSCSVQHTCIYAPPILTLSGVTGQDIIKDTLVSDGIWERRIERAWTVKEKDQSVTCSVSYSGGQKASSGLQLNVECPYEDIKMIHPPVEATEGVAKSVVCSVTYKCKKNTPNITWNFEDLQSSLSTKQLSIEDYKTESNLTFIGSLEDNGAALICTAHFDHGETSDSQTLQINKYEPQIEEIDAREHDTVWNADVPFRFSALTGSCVVVPCHFQYQGDLYLSRGIWSKKTGGVIYHNGRSNILDHFKDRTKIIGNLNEGNCTLEIDKIKPFDNGPFCFQGQIENVRHKFYNSCVFLTMRASPEKPVMTLGLTEVDAGSTTTASCSVTHTCSTHHPQFSWNVAVLTNKVEHTLTARGIWKTTSTISFTVAVGDGPKNLTCTAKFWGNKQQDSTDNLNVKGSLMYQFRRGLLIAVPVFLIVTVLGVVIYKKRKAIWSRFSRRHHKERQNPPPRPEKRRSMWSRFSRHQTNTSDFSVGYSSSAAVTCYDAQTSKPRFSSPQTLN